MRKERLKNEKLFPFFFYLFAHPSFMIASIRLTSVGKHLPSKNLHTTETYQSTCITFQLTGFSMRRALNVRYFRKDINPLNAKFTKWSNTLKQFVGNLPTNCLSVFGHFVGLKLKGLNRPRKSYLQ